MSDENPAVTAALEAALQTAIDNMGGDCTLTDWVITASGQRLEDIGERTQVFYIPKPQMPLHVARGLAITGSDYWRKAEESG